ncbi:MAG: serine--tRNA ligase [Chlamydiia bacterium]|nr:serine--tRNA ligase [Chlamydiia bacterium]
MIDFKEAIKSGDILKVNRRGSRINIEAIKLSINNKRELQEKVDFLRNKLNLASKTIGINKINNNINDSEIMSNIRDIKSNIDTIEFELKIAEDACSRILSYVPNIPLDEVPEGEDEKENVEVLSIGEKPAFDFTPKNHVELNEKLNIFDFVRAAKVSGRGNVFYQGKGARLEIALLNYMMDFQNKAGRTLMLAPYIVREESLVCAGQLPNLRDSLYTVDNDKYLIPTSETALISMYSDEIIKNLEDPIRLACYSSCFRKEAGSAGSDDRGLIRTHQFNKIEMISICTKEQANNEFSSMIDDVKSMLEDLELPYRIMKLCVGDLPFSSKITYDLEVWMSGQDRYYECSSISDCGDFQSRRGKIRYKNKNDKRTHYVNTINGSGIATSRIMVAILENNQDIEGNIRIPKVLQKYLDFKEIRHV